MLTLKIAYSAVHSKQAELGLKRHTDELNLHRDKAVAYKNELDYHQKRITWEKNQNKYADKLAGISQRNQQEGQYERWMRAQRDIKNRKNLQY